MGTRCGDVDAGVLAFLERTEGFTATQSEELLNKKSGLLGLSGISSDMREVLKAADEGQPRALLALKAYCYRVRKYIGAYVASMGGLDAVIFTGGIGQGSAEVRALALQGLECMGIHARRAAQPRRARLRRSVPHLDRRLEGGGAGRADRRGTHDGARSVARVEPLLHHARAGSAEAAAVSRRGLGASHPPHAGTRRGAVRQGPSTHQARRPFAARPVCLQGTTRHRRPEGPHRARPRARARRANTPRSRSR